MASSVMLFPPPGTQWIIDLDDFAEAARNQWPDASIAGPQDSNGEQVVYLEIHSSDDRMFECRLAIDKGLYGTFSIRRGADRAAAEVFAWVREHLGPDNGCVILHTSAGSQLVDIPYGSSVDQILVAIETLSSH